MVATANATNVPAGVDGGGVRQPAPATYTLNGVAISITGVIGAGALASNRANAVAAINAQSAATGVVATDTGAGVSLSAADGRNIDDGYAAGSFTGRPQPTSACRPRRSPAARVNLSYQAPSGVSGSVVFAQAGGLSCTTAIA